MIEASAPGKLVVIGEYAVLHGAPAIAVAVDVRARARITAARAAPNQLSVAGDPASWDFQWSERGLPKWTVTPGGGQGGILESVADVLRENGLLPLRLPPLRITLDSDAFQRSGADGKRYKLGLGSSAAVTVALTGALAEHFGQRPVSRDRMLGLCTEAHRRFQQGAGSGIDIATAVIGGVVRLVRDGVDARWEEVSWPRDLAWTALWTGSAASTIAMLERFEIFHASNRAAFASHVDDLRVISAAAVAAWNRSDAGNVLRDLREYDAALRRLDREAGIGIYTPAHERLAALAERHGAVYKPSGAGGGDFGIACSDSSEVIGNLSRSAEAAGIFVMPGKSDVVGFDLVAT